MNKETVEKYCLQCGTVINGRSDKLFCNSNCSDKHRYELKKNDPDYKHKRKIYFNKYRNENIDDIKYKKSIYQKENRLKCREQQKKWRESNRDHQKLKRKENKEYINNRDRNSKLNYAKINNAKNTLKYRTELRDCYIRNILTQDCEIDKNDIPYCLIETKRTIIKIKRLIKEMSNY